MPQPQKSKESESELPNVLPVPVEGVEDIFAGEIISLEQEIASSKKFSAEQLKAIRRICYYLAKVGLSLEEACIIVGFEPTEFKKIVESNPLVARLLAMKNLEYKKDLLSVISNKARTGDDKLATWLLQVQYPEQFNPKKGGRGGDDEDMLGMAISFIQKQGDGSPLVTEKSGKAFVVSRGDSSIMKKIGDFLS